MPLNYSMTSKKTAASKRAQPRAADYAKSFLKDWERLSRSGRYNMNQLKEAMLLLIAANILVKLWTLHPNVKYYETDEIKDQGKFINAHI